MTSNTFCFPTAFRLSYSETFDSPVDKLSKKNKYSILQKNKIVLNMLMEVG